MTYSNYSIFAHSTIQTIKKIQALTVSALVHYVYVLLCVHHVLLYSQLMA